MNFYQLPPASSPAFVGSILSSVESVVSPPFKFTSEMENCPSAIKLKSKKTHPSFSPVDLNDKKKKRQTNAEKGYEVCGQANKFKKPCQRVGVCPFHTKIGSEDLEDRIEKKSKKPKKEKKVPSSFQDAVSMAIDPFAVQLPKDESKSFEEIPSREEIPYFGISSAPLQKCSSTNSISSDGSELDNLPLSDGEMEPYLGAISEMWMTTALYDLPTSEELDFKDPFVEGLNPNYAFNNLTFNFNNASFRETRA